MTRFVPILMSILAVSATLLALPASAQNQQLNRQQRNPNGWPPCSVQRQQGCIMPNGQFIPPPDQQQPDPSAPGMVDQNLGIGDRRPSQEAPPPQ